ncbi:hypothetical protein [Haloarcula amylovorans]|uniref:hypothetical protein n=1 Tax=Haloarcula amylovorans TaxID=2562280 RepID=UPI0010766D89|nr:hypothetical protein [Halomicroarcula amylolytica]
MASTDDSDELAKIQDQLDELTAVIAYDAGLPVSQTTGGPPSVETSLDSWVHSKSGQEGTVYLIDPDDGSVTSEAYELINIDESGWVRCRDDADDSATVSYPPHRVQRIEQ